MTVEVTEVVLDAVRGRSAKLVVPADPRGGVVLVPDVAWAASKALTDALVESLTASGYASIALAPPSPDALAADRLTDDEALALRGNAIVEDLTGLAGVVLGVGVGALVAADLAMSGQVHGGVLCGVDPLLDSTLSVAWDEPTASFALADRVVAGEQGAVETARDLLAGLAGRRAPAPLLVVADLESLPHLDSQWCADPTLAHEVLAIAADGDLAGLADSTAWNTRKLAARVVRWLDELPVRRLADQPRVDGLLHPPAAAPADERGKVFISYTHRGEAPQRAQQIARLLDAAGVRNFLDRNDLGVGDIYGIIDRSLRQDCAGGVLVATEGLQFSDFVRHEELPRLLTAARRQDKALEVANDLKTIPEGKTEPTLDPDGPDRVMGLPKGTLRKLTHFDFDQPDDERGFLRGWLKRKLGHLQGEPVEIDIQSYVQDDVDHNWRSDLRIRTPLHLERDVAATPLPNPAMTALATAFPLVSDALHAAAPSRVTITGGGHAPVGLALGGVLVATKIKCPVFVEDDRRQLWGPLPDPDPGTSTMSASELPASAVRRLDAQAKRIAAYVEISQRPNTLFEEFVGGLDTPIAGALKLQRVGLRRVEPAEGVRLADSIAAEIRNFADQRGAHEIVLCGSFNFPMAVMIGRLLNTFGVVAYDLTKVVETAADGRKQVLDCWYHRVLDLSPDDNQVAAANADPVPTDRPSTFG